MSKLRGPQLNRHSSRQTRVGGSPSGRQSDAASYLLERVGEPDSDLSRDVMMKLIPLTALGVEITRDVIDKAISNVQAAQLRLANPRQVREPREYTPRPATGRFTGVSFVGSVVYYMRIGDRVKIGTSTNLRKRLSAINPEELLGYEEGGLGLERHRHKQFADLRTHGEWFKLEGALVEHLAALAAS